MKNLKNLAMWAVVALMLAGLGSCNDEDENTIYDDEIIIVDDENTINDDEITILDRNILGYWEGSTRTVDARGGLVFVSTGDIKGWQYSLLTGTGQYSESHWGYFWFDDDGKLRIQNRPKNSSPNPDELYYAVASLTKDSLVIRVFGGFIGTPYENGTDVVFKKIEKPDSK